MQEKITGISLSFENCQEYFIPHSEIHCFSYTTYDLNSFSKNTKSMEKEERVNNIRLIFTYESKDTESTEENDFNNFNILQRLNEYKDLTHISIHYEFGATKTLTIPFIGLSYGDNPIQYHKSIKLSIGTDENYDDILKDAIMLSISENYQNTVTPEEDILNFLSLYGFIYEDPEVEK